MKQKYTIRYKNRKDKIEIDGYSWRENIIGITYPGAEKEENLSGLELYAPNGELLLDCSDFKYRWNVLEDIPNKIYYTDKKENVQTQKFPVNNEDCEEEAEPLTNEELTEAVADLMYEVSIVQLGL